MMIGVLTRWVVEKQIDDTVDVMRNNIHMVSQRGERLDALQDKTDNLATQAADFRKGANVVRKKFWWKDMKMRMCLIVGIIILLLVIIVPGEFDNHFLANSLIHEADVCWILNRVDLPSAPR